MITIEDFKKKQTNKVRLLGLDLGSKRIGLSISDENQTIATPHKTLIKSSSDKLIDELRAIINENNIAPILPLIVLLGLILVSFLPLKYFPIKIPPISEKTHIKII